MNCQKHEWAMYRGNQPALRGQIVQCIEQFKWHDGRDSWRVAPCLAGNEHVLDSALRPIRHPGLAAVDEMVQRLGKPTRT